MSGKHANLVLAIASTIVALLLAEAVFRLLGLRGYHAPRTREWKHALVDEDDRLPGVSVQFKPHATFAFRYDSNPRGYFDATNGIVYQTNNHGFRGADFDEIKPPGVRRILVLGDSFTFGEGVRDEHTFCVRLQRLLDAGQDDVEVLNLGVSAWTTLDEINYLEQRALRFGPDLTIVVYVLNDAEIPGGLNIWETFRHKYEPATLRHSYLASYAFAAVARHLIGRRYVESLVQGALAEDEKWQRSLAALSRGRDLATAVGSDYLVVIFPFMYDLSDSCPTLPIHRMLREYCRSSGIECIDLFYAFKGHKDTDLWVHPSDQHPNDVGHQIAADALHTLLLERTPMQATH
jgi:lysophospholipase L1-like esterase